MHLQSRPWEMLPNMGVSFLGIKGIRVNFDIDMLILPQDPHDFRAPVTACHSSFSSFAAEDGSLEQALEIVKKAGQHHFAHGWGLYLDCVGLRSVFHENHDQNCYKHDSMQHD